MSRLTISDKAARAGKLLWGMRHPRVAAALAPFGFNAAVLAEGWDLVAKVNEQHLARVVSRPVAVGRSEMVDKVNAFENRWFPIVKHALSRRYPAAAERLFLNLARAEGKSAAYGVQVFVSRLTALEKGETPFGDEGPAAREFLRTRGLTDTVLAEVEHDLDGQKEIAQGEVPEPYDAEALEKAESEMWAFYLEWSAIVRGTITDGNLLRVLGFKKRAGGRTQKSGGEHPRLA